MADLPPRIGPYRILRLLAHGGMGRVYVAQDTRLGRVVALKMAHDELATRAEARAQFLVEARATARLAHPNVVSLFDVGEHEGAPWAAFEFVEGRTLRRRLREGPLDPSDALRVATEIASAVAAAHADGIVHRDLKPANVILGEDGRARVLDFGIARLVGSAEPLEDFVSAAPASEALEMLGTPSYMAPEQWSHDDGAPADVWALGLLFCEMWLGTQPLLRRPSHEILAELTRSSPLPMPAELDALPPPLASLIRACVEKASSKRPSSAEVEARLRELASGGPARPAKELDLDAFRGRARALAAVEERVRTSTWTLVVGPEGAGKTALLRALVGRVRGEVHFVDAAAGALATLARALFDRRRGTEDEPTWIEGAPPADAAPSAEALDAWLRANPERIALALSELASVGGDGVVLVVDGLEAAVSDRVSLEARALLAGLRAAALSGDARVRLVAAVDESALGRLPATLFANALVMRLETPDAEELRGVARETLADVGARVADLEALDALCETLAADPRPFVLLRFALAEAWRTRDAARGLVSFGALVGTGAASLLARHADAVFDALPTADQAEARSLLETLALEGSVSTTTLPRVVDALRLGGLVAGDAELRLAHPDLPRGWRRLSRWIAERDGDAWIARDIEDAHRRWVERGRSDDDLLRGRTLDAARALVARARLADDVAAFVRRSDLVHTRTRRRWRALRIALVVASVLAALGSGLSVWTTRRRAEDAEHARSTSERDRAELLARSARLHWESGDVRTARAQLRRSLELGDSLYARVLFAGLARDPELWRVDHMGLAYDVAFDDTNEHAYVAWQTGELSRFDVASGEERRFRADLDQVLSVVTLADGRVVTGDLSGILTLWTPTDSGDLRPHALRRLPRGVRRLVRTEPGVVVASLLGGEVYCVVVDGGEDRTWTLDETGVGLAWAADEAVVFVATSGGGIFRLEPDARVEPLARVTSAEAMVWAEPATLAVGGSDGALHYVDRRSGEVRTRRVARGRVRALAPLGEGRLLVGTLDGELLIPSDDGARRIASESAAVVGLAVGGERVVLGIADGARAIRWRAEPDVETRPAVPVLNVALTRDALYASMREEIVELDRDTGIERRRFTPFSGSREIRALTVDPSGERLAAWFSGIGVAVVDPRSGAATALAFEGATRVLSMQRFGDGLVYGTMDGDLVRLAWDGRSERRALDRGPVVVVGASDDEIWTGHGDGTLVRHRGERSDEVRRFDVAATGLFASSAGWLVLLSDGALHRLEPDGRWQVLASARARVYRASLAPDGAHLVAPGADGALHVWRLPGGEHHTLPLARRELNTAALDERGRFVATGGDDGVVRFVDLQDGRSPWAPDAVSTAFRSTLDDDAGRWRGENDGAVVREVPGQPPSRFDTELSLPVLHLARAAHDVLVVVQSAGWVELRHAPTRELVDRRRVRGEVMHVEVEGERVRVTADTGDAVELSLAYLGLPRCELLRALRESSPLTWVDGMARVAPPDETVCPRVREPPGRGIRARRRSGSR